MGQYVSAMALLFPGGATIPMENLFKIADIRAKGNRPLKTGGAGIIISEPEAINTVPVEEPLDENPFAHSFDLWRKITGIGPYVTPDYAPPNTPPDEVGFWQDMWNKMKGPDFDETNKGFTDWLSRLAIPTPQKEAKMSLQTMLFIGGGLLLLVLLIK